MHCSRLVPALLVTSALVACDRQPVAPDTDVSPQFKAVVNHSEAKVPIGAFATFIPCANGGAGELAVVSDAELHFVFKFVQDAHGGFHTAGHAQPIRNWDGIGQVTGDVYQATGVTRDNFNQDFDGFPFEFTFVNNFRWIGPGPGNNLLVHTTQHVTVNANGVITADVLKSSTECK